VDGMTDEVILPSGRATAVAAQLLAAAGAPPKHARTVALHLVDAEMCGARSHGLQRVPQYAAEIAAGEIDPSAEPAVDGGGARWLVDGRRGFGQVAGAAAVECLRSTVGELGLAFVGVHNTGHAGRIGAYVEALAAEGMVAIAVCSGPRSGHRVAPFGGIEGRLATNPIAWAAPRAGEAPLVSDLSTSSTAEGQIRLLRALGRSAPNGALQTATGEPTDDPAALYTSPPGTLQPLGGEVFGHKGTGLGLLVEVLATLLAGDDPTDAQRVGNNLALIGIGGGDDLAARVAGLAAYVRSSPPRRGVSAVLLPGEREQTARASATAVHLPPSTVQGLRALALELGSPIEPLLSSA
jgi:LDH2 family malate/lactate/ureidoglycolate dehydrogenase